MTPTRSAKSPLKKPAKSPPKSPTKAPSSTKGTTSARAAAGADKPASGGRRIQVRRSGIHGKGVFALKPILKGETIIEYLGEVITWKQAQRQLPHNPDEPNHTFLFHLDDRHVIDGTRGVTRRAGSTTPASPTAKRRITTAGFSSRPCAISGRARS